jgi:hypothetical protein
MAEDSTRNPKLYSLCLPAKLAFSRRDIQGPIQPFFPFLLHFENYRRLLGDYQLTLCVANFISLTGGLGLFLFFSKFSPVSVLQAVRQRLARIMAVCEWHMQMHLVAKFTWSLIFLHPVHP